jgi:4'-phosphopantetheinyl transferase
VSLVQKALEWLPGSISKPLETNEVHLWRIPHEIDARELVRYERFLSGDELEQASRFRAPRSRKEFTQTRACLRLLLAHYSDLRASSLHFSAGPFGKPALVGVPLSFNVSHTEGVSIIAIARHAAVGVDVERVLAALDLLAIAADHFSANELSKLRSVTGAELTESFFRCWTRKEAFLKAQGLGLPHGLNAFEVTLLPHEAPAVLTCTWVPAAPERWGLLHFEPMPGVFGALATEGPIEESAQMLEESAQPLDRPAQMLREPALRVVPLDWSTELAAQLLSSFHP